jgi:DNA uptake protein ComE-like DNA-binding protein
MLILLKLFPYLFRNSAAILFVALWTLVILSILAVGIASRVSSEINLAKYLDNKLISFYLAQAAVDQAIIELKNKDEKKNYDTLYELRRKREAILGEGSFEFYLTDEESLINISTPSSSLIEHLPGLDPILVEAITQSPLKPFLLKEELLLIEGVTPEIFSQFKDLITTYSCGQVNINTASAPVLSALGLGDDLINIILDYRKGENDQEATEDDREFNNTASILNDLRRFTILTVEQELKIAELLSKNLLCVNSSNIKLNISTKVHGKPSMHYTIILERSSSKIKFWQEN